MEKIHGDRRTSQRYSMELGIRYKVAGAKRVLHAGQGKTCDLSSGGISFQSGELLPAGMQVELVVEWPAMAPGGHGTQLLLSGRIVWSDGTRTAVRTTSYEFLRQEYRPEETVARTYVA